MTWQELEDVDAAELILMPVKFNANFPPVKLDDSITIGMAAHGNISTTIFAIRALFASVSGNFELILVDDASPDETGKLFELVPQIHQNTKVFRFQHNLEYSGSLNTILSHSSGNHVIFISNDIFITSAYIKQLLSVAQRYPDAGIVRGCSNFVDNGLLSHNINDCGELDDFDALFSYADERAKQFELRIIDDQYLTGDAFLVTRNLLDKIGYIDSRFYGYFADHDFSLRAKRAGFKPALALGAFAWHQHGSNMDYLPQKAKEEKLRNRWARVNENWARFKEKYNLPVSLPYKGMRRIPWEALSKSVGQENKLEKPIDNSVCLVPVLGTNEWLNYRAQNMCRQARKLMQSAQLTEAETLCRQILLLDGNCSSAFALLGAVLAYQGRLADGLKTLRKAVKKDPLNDKAYSNLLLCMNYADEFQQKDIFKVSKCWGERYQSDNQVVFPQKRSRIRVAYLSPDFKRHSISYFFLPLIEQHDRICFEIYCISDVAVPDEITEKISSLADGWLDIYGLSNDEAELAIRNIGPDILVDLSGHTGEVIRLPIFANRVAPIQLSWLGYPNTTGLNQMDYRLTDSIADPESAESDVWYTEKLVRLPGCFLCYQPPKNTPEVSPLPALKNGYISFGCFNMLPKIQKDIIKTWCMILNRIPNSRFIIKNHYLRDVATARRIVKCFKQYGVEPSRLELLCSTPTTTEHLAQYHKVDIALDTFPYNGTTTTCEALWMGVPVVTLSGGRHASRVGSSIMKTMGLDAFVADNTNEYCELACRLVSDIHSLQEIREGLRIKMFCSELCDSELFSSKIETTFKQLLMEGKF